MSDWPVDVEIRRQVKNHLYKLDTLLKMAAAGGYPIALDLAEREVHDRNFGRIEYTAVVGYGLEEGS